MIDWVGEVREATIEVDWSGETECGKLSTKCSSISRRLPGDASV